MGCPKTDQYTDLGSAAVSARARANAATPAPNIRCARGAGAFRPIMCSRAPHPTNSPTPRKNCGFSSTRLASPTVARARCHPRERRSRRSATTAVATARPKKMLSMTPGPEAALQRSLSRSTGAPASVSYSPRGVFSSPGKVRAIPVAAAARRYRTPCVWSRYSAAIAMVRTQSSGNRPKLTRYTPRPSTRSVAPASHAGPT